MISASLMAMNAPNGAATFDPATLNLTEWFRASYVGVPHAGTASAGTSGTRTMDMSLAAPDVGTAVNGFTPIGVTPSGDKSGKDTSSHLSDLISASAYTIAAILMPRTSTGSRNSTDPYLEKSIVAEAGSGGAYVGLSCSLYGICGYHYDGTDWTGPVVSASLDVWHLIVARYDGTNLKISKNGGTDVTLAKGHVAGSPGLSSSRLVIGINYGEGGAGQKADILDLMISPTYLSDGDVVNLKSYANARYGLSL